jgi:hypothetical protein
MPLRLVVDSSTVLSVAYDRRSATLEVEFRHANEVYRFTDVPLQVYEGLLAAASKGEYFNEHVRDDYHYVRV